MTRRFIFGVLWLAAASAALGQNIRQAAVESHGPRTLAKAEARKILAAIPAVDADAQSETDCSHLVHDIYEQAGFAYGYATSRELYAGNAKFTPVRAPQAGDLVVWPGHVGIVVDPKQHSFFSFVRSGADTQFYDSPYWRARGTARFFRYVVGERIDSDRTFEAAVRTDEQPRQREDARASVFQVAGKEPSPEEVMAAFVEMTRNSGESLRTPSLNGSGKSVIVYRELRVSSVQIKGKRGTALVRIDSLGASSDTPNLQPGWTEQSLELEKTKRGWMMRPVEGVAYVKREVAFQVLSARLAELSQNQADTPELEREQRQIIRFLSALVSAIPDTASVENN